MEYTSIQIRPKTRERLARMRNFQRETYDELLNKMIDAMPIGDSEGEYTPKFIEGLMKARAEVREGKVYGHEEMKKRLGI
ncbi:MAG: hypothetical protein V1835_04335 [Candidatus Micrarchaeota archaeon]